MSESSAPAVGVVSPDGQFRWDGQQWAPIPKGTRDPTAWTRPMQVVTAAFFALEAAISVVVTLLTINRDSMLRVMQAQGSLPAGADVNTVINVGLTIAYIGVGIFVVVELIIALGSYLRWRWMFWVALVFSGLGAIGAFSNLSNFANPSRSYAPLWGVALNEIVSLGSLALFVWLLIGVIRFGPWAMKQPGT